MVAVVVVPLVVLLGACLMERLEARVAPVASAPARPRRAAGGDTAPAGPARRHLRAVPALTPGEAADEVAEESWSRAS